MPESTVAEVVNAVPTAVPVAAAVDWSDPDPSRPLPLLASLREDIVALVPLEDRNRSRLGWALVALRIALRLPGFKVTFCYRLNHTLYHYGGIVGKVIAGLVNWVVHHLYFAAISPRARIHGGLVLPHPQGIIIGPDVVVGPRAWIFQNVTMGPSAGKNGLPRLGAGCQIHCGAVVCGPISVGDEVIICPNSLLQRNVPSRSMAVGVPANVMPQFAKPKIDARQVDAR